MKSEIITAVIGVFPGYGHDNTISLSDDPSYDEISEYFSDIIEDVRLSHTVTVNPENIFNNAITQACSKAKEETGLYPPFNVISSKTYYDTEFGCPPGGEVTFTISSVYNPVYHIHDLWLGSVNVAIATLKDILSQSTITVTREKCNLEYKTDNEYNHVRLSVNNIPMVFTLLRDATKPTVNSNGDLEIYPYVENLDKSIIKPYSNAKILLGIDAIIPHGYCMDIYNSSDNTLIDTVSSGDYMDRYINISTGDKGLLLSIFEDTRFEVFYNDDDDYIIIPYNKPLFIGRLREE